MKRITGRTKIDVIIVSVALILVGYALVKHKADILLGIFVESVVFIFFYVMIYQSNFDFAYDEEKLIVENNFIPTRTVEYILKEIEEIRIINTRYLGLGIRIKFKDKRRRAYHTRISRELIQNMVDEIHQLLGK